MSDERERPLTGRKDDHFFGAEFNLFIFAILKMRGTGMVKGNSIRFKVLMRDGFKCKYCGKTGDEKQLEVDHIIPRSRGGTNALVNLVTACFECNRGKRDKMIIENMPEVEVSEQTKSAIEAYKKKVQEDDTARVFINYFLKNAPHEHELNGHELRMFRDYNRKFHADIVFEAIDIAIDRYIPDPATDKDYYLAIKKIGGISHNKMLERF